MKKMFIAAIEIYKKHIFKKKSTLGINVKIGFMASISNQIKSSIIIGNNSSLHAQLICSANGSIKIGNYCSIRYKTLIESETCVKIGNYVIISNNVIISDNNSHSTSFIKRRKMLESGEYGELWLWNQSDSSEITIQDDVWIGRNSFILKGVNIGRGSIIASGTVVTKNVPPYSLCYGNPCQIKEGIYKDENN